MTYGIIWNFLGWLRWVSGWGFSIVTRLDHFPNFRSEHKDHLWVATTTFRSSYDTNPKTIHYSKKKPFEYIRDLLQVWCPRNETSVAKSLKKWQKKHFYHLIPPQIELFYIFRKCLRLCFGSFFPLPGRLEVSTLPNAQRLTFDSPVTRLEQYSARMVLTG